MNHHRAQAKEAIESESPGRVPEVVRDWRKDAICIEDAHGRTPRVRDDTDDGVSEKALGLGLFYTALMARVFRQRTYIQLRLS